VDVFRQGWPVRSGSQRLFRHILSIPPVFNYTSVDAASNGEFWCNPKAEFTITANPILRAELVKRGV
jgi:hypothetical protein